MKLIVVALLFFRFAFAQEASETWNSFYGENDLRGFKDSLGKIQIAPKFTGFTMAWRFKDIMAATEEVNGKWETYYLLKDGTVFGRDSVYMHEFYFDCESEGLIKFYDRKSDKVGMFGKNGKVAIPAEYNAMSGFRNGLAVTLAGAEKSPYEA